MFEYFNLVTGAVNGQDRSFYKTAKVSRFVEKCGILKKQKQNPLWGQLTSLKVLEGESVASSNEFL